MVKRPGHAEAGFTYLTVLFIVAMMAPALALLGEAWHTAQRRDREAELLHVGNAYRRAIMLYYESAPSGPRRFPRELEHLLKDERYPGTRRYLRKLFRDPITGSEQWGLLRSPDGGIMGVYSLSRERPLKQANFALLDTGLAGASSYADWKFVYLPTPAVAPRAAPSSR